MLGNSGHLEQPASPVLMILMMRAGTVRVPAPHAIDRLRASRGCALNVVVHISTVVTIVGSACADLIRSAFPVLVIIIVMLAAGVCQPSSDTVHRLRASSNSALLEIVREGARVTVVGSLCADLVQPAAPVLVVLAVMEAGSIRSPGTHAVHRLGAAPSCALIVIMGVRAAITVMGSSRADLVQPAAPVLVVAGVMLARSVRSPGTLAVHRLSTAALGPLLIHVSERTVVTIVGRVHGNLVVAVPLILVLSLEKVNGIHGTEITKRTDITERTVQSTLE